ncbi:hypothetical protein I0Q12_01815 [Rhodococcus sp. CX]|uniref:hypothetical protein n=1 Tax=Rhodococcus sp. CX TaxID=2789880 RepID=UPI0018CCB2E0|nr:hypothetical protein [Rhodococcus sp. CX]MBH0118339.1 hypothetical protein [Rhodococcus sp. CX]
MGVLAPEERGNLCICSACRFEGAAMTNSRSLRLLVAVLGVLAVAGAAIFNIGFVGQTLASWTDRVFGGSTYGVNAASLQGYAHALGGRFQINRLVSSETVGGATAERFATNTGTTQTPATGFTQYHSDGLLGIVATELDSAVCASYLSSSDTCADYGSTTPPVHSVAVARNLKTSTGEFLGVTRFFSTTGEQFKTTASCVPGTAPTAGAVQSTSGRMYVGDNTSNPIAIPIAPSGAGTRSQSTSKSFTSLARYEVVLTHTRVQEADYASSTLRLRMSAYALVVGTHQWTLDLVVLHAGCGIGTATQPLPSVSAATPVTASAGFASDTPLASMMMSRQTEATTCHTDVDSTVPEDEANVEEVHFENVDTTPVGGESVSAEAIDAEPVDSREVPNESEAADDVTDNTTEPVSCEPEGADSTVLSPVDLLVEEGIIGEAEPQSELARSEEEGATDTEILADDVDARDVDDAGDDVEESDDPEGDAGRSVEATDEDKAGKENAGAAKVDGAKDAADSGKSATPDNTPESGGTEDAPVAEGTPESPAPTSSTSANPTPASAPVSAPSRPTTPSRVSTAVPFTMVATDGSDLGEATVRDISRTDGCVAVLLDVTTSDGSGTTTLNGLRSNDFREVLADGTTTPVGSPTGPCAVDAPMPTSFGPSATYSGWVMFDVTNGGNSVMLRPVGTAGWIITLPPAPPSPAPAPVVTATPTAVETAPATSTPATTEETAPAEEPVEE